MCIRDRNNCKVPIENVLKGVGNGFPIAMNALDNSRIGIAAQALGIAQGAYEAALNYSHEREAFGKPIAHHQMIMNYLADMATRIQAARDLVYRASWAKQEHTMKMMAQDTPKKPVWQSCLPVIQQCGSQSVPFRCLEDMVTRKNFQLSASSEMLKSRKFTKELKRCNASLLQGH